MKNEKNKSKYIRVGTSYYKEVLVPLPSGDTYKTLHKWKKSEIITDEGKDYLDKIEKYDGFCSLPSHTNHQQVVEEFYNIYEKTDHEFIKGEFPKTHSFLKHIFGDQLELGIDYLTILWKKPIQILPILCLVSSERKTGKTTFLNWLKLIFQGNMTINKNEDLRSRFNSDWSSKLIIAVDEVLLDKREDTERLKNLSTSVSHKTESKGVDKVETPFFGKFILCSNNEENFILIDKDEIRYWVRQIPSINDENENADLLSELKEELPFFMEFLSAREIMASRKTRMWFSKDDIKTDALLRLINGNRAKLNKELEEIIREDFLKYEVNELKYSLGDLVELLSKSNIRVTTSKVSSVLMNHFESESKNGSYPKYYLAINPISNMYETEKTTCKGRYFTFRSEDFLIDSDVELLKS